MQGQKSHAPEIAIIVAMSAHDRALGKEGKLLWHISDDLKRFKKLTEGHPVIMGRKTFESIVEYLNGPLPERTNIVITRNIEYHCDHRDVIICPSLETALSKAKEIDSDRIVIGGGSEIYTQALPLTTKLYLTLIDDTKGADAFFPPYEHLFTKKVREESHTTEKGLRYTWIDLER